MFTTDQWLNMSLKSLKTSSCLKQIVHSFHWLNSNVLLVFVGSSLAKYSKAEKTFLEGGRRGYGGIGGDGRRLD